MNGKYIYIYFFLKKEWKKGNKKLFCNRKNGMRIKFNHFPNFTCYKKKSNAFIHFILKLIIINKK